MTVTFLAPPLAPHEGHQLAAMSGRVHPERALIGRLVCATCDVVVGPLVVCGARTKAGRSCRTPIRADLGYTACWSHGAGKGRTSTPRRMRRAS